jgi:hypothetical protein
VSVVHAKFNPFREYTFNPVKYAKHLSAGGVWR